MVSTGSAGLPRAMRGLFAALLICALAACGGGGGGGSSTTAPLPATLSLSVPAGQQALGTTLSFSATASDPALIYLWDFGDGSSSTLAAPTHTYARAGVFTVRLTVGDGDGGVITSSASVAVADFAVVAGKACSGPAQSGWCWQRPLPQGNNIQDYDFVDDLRGWAVGDGGVILATVNGGVSWTAQVSGTSLNLRQVEFVSPLVGWVVGTNGEMLRTADGGASWQRFSLGRNDTVETLGVGDANTAWVSVFGGQAFVTTNGGQLWRIIPAAPGGSYKLKPVSSSDIWSLPPFVDPQPSLSHSLDGGLTWSVVPLPPIEPGLSGYSDELRFADPAHALVIGYESGVPNADPSTFVSRQTVRITADRGATWQNVALPSFDFHNYRLADATTIYALNFGSLLLRTSDNGATWTQVPLPAVTGFFASSFEAYSAQRLLVSDGSGRAWLTTDGGQTWNARSAQGVLTASINSVWFFDSRQGLGTADDGSFVRTSDGGQTWTTTASPSYNLRRLQFLADGSIGWVLSDQGAIHRTTDRGATWTPPLPTSPNLNPPLLGASDFHFIDALRGWAIAPGDYSGQGAVHSTVDGGTTWQPLASTRNFVGYFALRFADALHGVAVGPNGFALVTSDGGASWTARPTGTRDGLRRVQFVDATTVVAVGEQGAIVRSLDRGQTWSAVASPTTRTLNDVRFLAGGLGHAVGDGGTQIVTRDGGVTWNLVLTNVQVDLRSVFFLDAQTGWAAGANGSILATATGGR